MSWFSRKRRPTVFEVPSDMAKALVEVERLLDSGNLTRKQLGNLGHYLSDTSYKRREEYAVSEWCDLLFSRVVKRLERVQ